MVSYWSESAQSQQNEAHKTSPPLLDDMPRSARDMDVACMPPPPYIHLAGDVEPGADVAGTVVFLVFFGSVVVVVESPLHAPL